VRSSQALRNLAFNLADELKLVDGIESIRGWRLSNNLQIELDGKIITI
jgi:hypothetical protein